MPRIIHRRRVFRAICLALASLLMLSSHAAETAGERPNVVFFVSDDLGWRDVGCYGSPNVKTPNLDRLAAEGMRFANADTASPVCGATRAQLYSGMYPGSYGSVGGVVRPSGWPALSRNQQRIRR